jgi:hypothetical protein
MRGLIVITIRENTLPAADSECVNSREWGNAEWPIEAYSR